MHRQELHGYLNVNNTKIVKKGGKNFFKNIK